jgi:molybdenum-dependent DNA-binding transcriptional regulator ModE
MSNSPKVLSKLANKAYSLLKNAHGAKSYKKAAKALGVSFNDVAGLVSDAKAYHKANVWNASDLDNADWSAFNAA